MDSALISSLMAKAPVHHELLIRYNSQTFGDIETKTKRQRFGSSRTMTDSTIITKPKNLSDPRLLDSNLFSTSSSDDLSCAENVEYNEIEVEKNISSLIDDINSQLESTLNTNTTNYKKSNPVVVKLYLVFLKISEIDTIKERFRAEAFIESNWIDNEVNADEEFDPNCHWNPELKIENGIGDVKQEIRYKVSKTSNNNTEIHEMRMVRGVFWESMPFASNFTSSVDDQTNYYESISGYQTSKAHRKEFSVDKSA
jgi:hypothetical protein